MVSSPSVEQMVGVCAAPSVASMAKASSLAAGAESSGTPSPMLLADVVVAGKVNAHTDEVATRPWQIVEHVVGERAARLPSHTAHTVTTEADVEEVEVAIAGAAVDGVISRKAA